MRKQFLTATCVKRIFFLPLPHKSADDFNRELSVENSWLENLISIEFSQTKT